VAATAPVLHADQLQLSVLVGENLALGNAIGLLLDADVGGAKTATTMKAAVDTNALPLHAEFQGYVDRIQRAIDYGEALGILSTANVQGVTTVAELVAITGAPAGKVGGPLTLE
jgi:hypothetical protein